MTSCEPNARDAGLHPRCAPSSVASEEQFAAQGLAMSRAAGVVDGLHGYFACHYSRLYKTCSRFNLLSQELGAVLDIGPFFGYTPFLLRPRSGSYVVLEGDDPAVYPLKPLYEEHQITCQFIDLFESFGPTHAASHRLAFADDSFDTVLCWETMEHFNFNPVKFVRELRRVLKPGGRAYITVPNKASFQNLARLLLGRGERSQIDSYFTFEDYVCNGKTAFYGFHWREYSAPELHRLFERAGFSSCQAATFTAFQAHSKLPLLRRLMRLSNQVLAGILPRYATHVSLVARK